MEWIERVRGTRVAYFALYAYEPQGPGEVDVREEEVVLVLSQHDEHQDSSWWRVERSDGVVGVVPGSYLEAVSPTASVDYYLHRVRTSEAPKLILTEAPTNLMPMMPPPLPPPTTQPAPPQPAMYPTFSEDHVTPPMAPTYSVGGDPKGAGPVSMGRSRSLETSSNSITSVDALRRSASMAAGSGSVDGMGDEDGVSGIPATLDPRVYGSEDFMLVQIKSPRKTGLMGKVLSWRVVTQTNLGGFGGHAFSNRREYEDFMWLRESLALDLPNAIVPPLPEAAGTFGKVDEYFISKRTMALQTFVDRLSAHSVIRAHPLVQIFLEATSAELKRAKKAKKPKKETFRHPSDQHKPDRDQRLLRAQQYYKSLGRSLKDLADRAEQLLKNTGAGGSNSTANYPAVWYQVAENEPATSYLGKACKALGAEVKTLDTSMQFRYNEMEVAFRQGLKDTTRYLKEAEAYLGRIFDLEDTVQYWVLQTQSKKESLSHKEATRDAVSQRASAPVAVPVDPQAVNNPSLAAVVAKQEKREIEKYKKAVKEQRNLDKMIAELERDVQETEDSLESARKRLDAVRAVMWDELTSFDMQKDLELQRIHRQWLTSRIQAHNEAVERFSKLLGDVDASINMDNRSIQ